MDSQSFHTPSKTPKRTTWLLALFVLMLGQPACFKPGLPDVSFRCGTQGQCPSGYECRSDGCCHRKGSPDVPADYCAPAEDAQPADAAEDAGTDAQGDATQTDAQPADAAEAADIASIDPSQLIVTEGAQANLTLHLDRPAQAGGVTVTVSTNPTGPVTAPATVTVPGGQTQALLPVTALASGDATVTATITSSVQAQVTVAAATASPGDVVLTEFSALPSGGGIQGEWIEVYNPGPKTYDLSGWVVTIDATSANVQAADLTQDPVYLGPGAWAFGVPNPAQATDIPSSALFVYGQPGSAPEIPDTGAVLDLSDGSGLVDQVSISTLVSDPNATVGATEFPGIADRSTQLDPSCLTAASNDSPKCWCVPAMPTPGTANPSCLADLVINEAMPDPGAQDDRLEFVELHGTAGADLTGVRIRWASGDGTVVGSFTLADRMPNDGYWVLADDNGGQTLVANADNQAVLGLADEAGGIQLLLPDSTAADALGYGALWSTTDKTDGWPLVETTLNDVVALATGYALARDAQSTDTNHNADDFHSVNATPGVRNQP
ncbi:MAG: lamin tail domain-containing protein [Deltaproteobacteria bacterium]|nr:lamin tail domain-containing protein [Deltaproteobacteria bacterium]